MKDIKYEGVKALTFTSIMSAISLVFVLITYFVSGTGLFLILVLPLIAALVALKVNLKYSLIYIFATFAMSFIDFQNALFVILPSLISGIIFGYLIRTEVQGYYIIFLISVLNIGLQIGATYLVKGIYQIDLINVYSNVFHIKYEVFSSIYYLFLFVLSLIQTVITYIIMTNEIKKIGFVFNEKKNHYIWILLTTLIFSLLSVILINFAPSLSYVFIGFSLYFGVVLGYYHFSYYQKKLVLIIQDVLYALSLLFMFVLMFTLPSNYKPLVLLLPVLGEFIMSIIVIIYSKIIKKEKLNNTVFENKN
jgi:hypothetical protein